MAGNHGRGPRQASEECGPRRLKVFIGRTPCAGGPGGHVALSGPCPERRWCSIAKKASDWPRSAAGNGS